MVRWLLHTRLPLLALARRLLPTIALFAVLPLPADAASDADALIKAAKTASGGAAWDKLHAWHETGTLAASGLSGSYETWLDLDRARGATAFVLGPSSGSLGWDGTRAWSTDSSKQVRVETSAEAVAQAIQDNYRAVFGFFFPDRFPAERTIAGERQVDGKSFDAVKITPKGAEPFEVWFDRDTHLIAREVQLTGVQPQSFLYSDWRPTAGGILAAYKLVDRTGDKPEYDQTSTIATVDTATPVDPARFAPPPPPVDDTEWPAGASFVTVPFQLLNDHIYVEASINGKPPALFVFDTGAINVLDPQAAKGYGVAIEGKLPGGGFGDKIADVGLARVKSIAIGGLTLPNQVFATIDNGDWPRIEDVPSAGLLGYEFVKRAILSVDYAKRTLTFTKPSAFHPPKDATAIPFTFSEHVPMVTATVDGISGEFEVDTGSRGPLTLMRPFAEAHDLVTRYHATVHATTGYGVGGPSRALLARARTLAIGPVTISAPVTELNEDTRGAAAATHTAGNIGGDLLKRFTMTLDYGHQLMWLEPNAAAQGPDVFDRSGLWISRMPAGGTPAGEMIEIDDVTAGSAGAKAGLAAGDHILAVDGKPASGVRVPDLRERFKATPGTRITLDVERKGERRQVTVELADQI